MIPELHALEDSLLWARPRRRGSIPRSVVATAHGGVNLFLRLFLRRWAVPCRRALVVGNGDGLRFRVEGPPATEQLWRATLCCDTSHVMDTSMDIAPAHSRHS